MPSVLENEAPTIPIGGEMPQMPNGSPHKEVMHPPDDKVEEERDEADADGDDDSDPASEEPITVMETEEYKETIAESGESNINGTGSPFLHTYVEDDEEESDFDEDDIQVAQ